MHAAGRSSRRNIIAIDDGGCNVWQGRVQGAQDERQPKGDGDGHEWEDDAASHGGTLGGGM